MGLSLGFMPTGVHSTCMAKTIGARTDDEHREALDRLVEHSGADSRSEALRQTSQAELARRGYLNGTRLDTPLRRTVREFARLFAYAGFAWFGFAVLWSVEVRLGGLALLGLAAVLLAVDRALGAVEPRVTERLHALVPGGEAA